MTDVRAALQRAISSTPHTLEHGSDILRTGSPNRRVCADSLGFLRPWLREAAVDAIELTPAYVLTRSNSAYPRSRNDGALWTGAGVNATISAGARAKWRFITAAIQPVFLYQQNRDFEFPLSARPGLSEFAHPDYSGIDWPKRPGAEAVTDFDPGNSYIRADFGPVTASFSNENLWLGPAQVFPLLISNTAPGFAHVRVGTRHPIDLHILKAEINIFWGSVHESEYFDGDPDNNAHMFTATSLVLEPKGIPGLHLGIARAYHDPDPVIGQSIRFFLSRILESPFYDQGGNRPGNGIGAAYLRWVLPESGFEVYGEYSAEDTPGNLEMALRQPDDTRAYALGLQKVVLTRGRLTRWYAELVNLEQSATVRSGRGFYSVYTHGAVSQGHTHKGQLLGASIGPGSSAEVLGLDVFTARSQTGLILERARYDDDIYYETFSRRFGEGRHDVEVTAELRRLQFVRAFSIEGVLRVSRQYDRDFLALRADGAKQIETNWGTELSVSWNPR